MSYPVLELVRLEEDSRYGTFGVLKVDKVVFCVTLELADRLNTQNTSSIPAQQYRCRRHASPRFGETFKVLDVPERSNVLVHSGNRVGDTRGCILLAQYFGKLRGDRAVLNSGNTFKAFMARMGGYDEAHLTITEHY